MKAATMKRWLCWLNHSVNEASLSSFIVAAFILAVRRFPDAHVKMFVCKSGVIMRL
jgi:hypothetical protein